MSHNRRILEASALSQLADMAVGLERHFSVNRLLEESLGQLLANTTNATLGPLNPLSYEFNALGDGVLEKVFFNHPWDVETLEGEALGNWGAAMAVQPFHHYVAKQQQLSKDLQRAESHHLSSEPKAGQVGRHVEAPSPQKSVTKKQPTRMAFSPEKEKPKLQRYGFFAEGATDFAEYAKKKAAVAEELLGLREGVKAPLAAKSPVSKLSSSTASNLLKKVGTLTLEHEWQALSSPKMLEAVLASLPLAQRLEYTTALLSSLLLSPEAVAGEELLGTLGSKVLPVAGKLWSQGLRFFGRGTQGLKNATIRQHVLTNISLSKLARESSNFEIHSIIEKIPFLNITTDLNTSVFWSGPGNQELAENFANLSSKFTLEMTPGGQYLDSLKLFDRYTPKQAILPWERLSARFAQNVSGQVSAFVEGSRPSSVFNRIEYSLLLNNPNVSEIIFSPEYEYTNIFKPER